MTRNDLSEGREPIAFKGRVERETAKAVLVSIPGQPGNFWLPRSQVENGAEMRQGFDGEIAIARWLANAKGLRVENGRVSRNPDADLDAAFPQCRQG